MDNFFKFKHKKQCKCSNQQKLCEDRSINDNTFIYFVRIPIRANFSMDNFTVISLHRNDQFKIRYEIRIKNNLPAILKFLPKKSNSVQLESN